MQNFKVLEENGEYHLIIPFGTEHVSDSRASVPLVDFVADFLEMIQSQLRSNTLQSYREMLSKHFIPFFGKRLLREIRMIDIQHFCDQKCREGYSPTSILKYHAILHKCFKYAVSVQILDRNPADNTILPRKQKYIGHVFDIDQINCLLQASKGSPAEAAITLAATYGLRRSEAAGLRWCAVDFKQGTIVINHTAVKVATHTLYADSVKTNSSFRTLPLTNEMRKYLIELRLRQSVDKKRYGKLYYDNDYICRRDNGLPLRPDYISAEFTRILKRTGLPRIRFHDLRHSAATLLLHAGFSLKQIQEWLGHADITTTANIYAHMQYADKIGMAEKLENLIEL